MTNPSPSSSPFEQFAERVYNKPPVPSFTRAMTQEDLHPSERGGRVARGTCFLRWHELSDGQRETVRDALRQALESTGLLSLVEERPTPSIFDGGFDEEEHRREAEMAGEEWPEEPSEEDAKREFARWFLSQAKTRRAEILRELAGIAGVSELLAIDHPQDRE